MGLLHVIVLRAVYPRLRILVSDTLRERLDLALGVGANLARLPGEDGIGAAVRAETAGLGADAVFDTVGSSRVLDAALGMTREGGAVELTSRIR